MTISVPKHFANLSLAPSYPTLLLKPPASGWLFIRHMILATCDVIILRDELCLCFECT